MFVYGLCMFVIFFVYICILWHVRISLELKHYKSETDLLLMKLARDLQNNMTLLLVIQEDKVKLRQAQHRHSLIKVEEDRKVLCAEQSIPDHIKESTDAIAEVHDKIYDKISNEVRLHLLIYEQHQYELPANSDGNPKHRFKEKWLKISKTINPLHHVRYLVTINLLNNMYIFYNYNYMVFRSISYHHLRSTY